MARRNRDGVTDAPTDAQSGDRCAPWQGAGLWEKRCRPQLLFHAPSLYRPPYISQGFYFDGNLVAIAAVGWSLFGVFPSSGWWILLRGIWFFVV